MLLEALRASRERGPEGEGGGGGPERVALVETWSGDPELRTLKVVRAIEAADLVLYDRLVSNDVLDLVGESARLLYIGKTAGYHSRTQEEIHELLLSFAETGANVVWLRGGDPLVVYCSCLWKGWRRDGFPTTTRHKNRSYPRDYICLRNCRGTWHSIDPPRCFYQDLMPHLDKGPKEHHAAQPQKRPRKGIHEIFVGIQGTTHKHFVGFMPMAIEGRELQLENRYPVGKVDMKQAKKNRFHSFFKSVLEHFKHLVYFMPQSAVQNLRKLLEYIRTALSLLKCYSFSGFGSHDLRMNTIKVSNIMGIDPKPFDRKTYVEEDVFVTDDSGTKKRIRLEDNIVRWRTVKNANGMPSCESNARIVKWKDGSMQLLIGNEVLDISIHEAHHDQSHLFLRNGKGVLQSQGRLLRKMRFMPSSLSSKLHRIERYGGGYGFIALLVPGIPNVCRAH
ncbi:hypothetical protein ABZP36_024906 [Zizania latifolia]